jgi:hypothetical protein
MYVDNCKECTPRKWLIADDDKIGKRYEIRIVPLGMEKTPSEGRNTMRTKMRD